MTKYLCDRCGKEVKSSRGVSALKDIVIPVSKMIYSIQTERFEVCEDCKREYDAIIDKESEIRILMFRDFIPKGVDKV